MHPNPKKTGSYLALGDSYTIGEGVALQERWPSQLLAQLNTPGIAWREPVWIAQTGWTTGELAAAIDHASPSKDHDLVSVLIGVNNQYREYPLSEYHWQLVNLLQRAIDFAGGRRQRVFAMSIPDWGVTPFARSTGRNLTQISAGIDAFNSVASDTCKQLDIDFIDITPISRILGARANMLVDDGLHPSGAMYAQWMRLALPIVTKKFLSR